MLVSTLSLLTVLPALPTPQSLVDPAPRELLSNVRIVAAIDVDGDGLTELIGTEADRVLRSYRTDAAGQLIGVRDLAPAEAPFPAIEAVPQVAADLDGDGLLDLVGTRFDSSPSNYQLTVWFDRGGSGFEAPENIASFDTSFVPYSVFPDDFDGDGDLDLVLHPEGFWQVGGTFVSQVQVVFNLGSAGFSAPTAVQTSSESFVATSPIDLDQDGDIDLIGLRGSSGAVAILRNTGGALQVEAVPTSRPATRHLTVGDINLDGSPDAVAFHTDALSPTITVGDIDVYLGDAAGGLQAPQIALSVVDASPMIRLGDVNGDGSLDLLLTELGFAVTVASGIRVHAGDGAGQFGQAVRSSEAPGIVFPRPLLVGDFSGDGRDDAVATQRDEDGQFRTVIRVAESGTAGSSTGFKAPVLASGEAYVGPALFADINADGIQDLVAAIDDGDGTSGDIVWARGTPESSPAFEAGRLIGIRGVPVLIADLDGSGPADLSVVVAGSFPGPGLCSVEINPNGTLEKPLPIGPYVFGFNETPQALDWDEDGDLDLVGIEPGGRSLVWLEQTGPGIFAGTAANIVTGDPASFLVGFRVGDFNGDGTLDVATSAQQLFSASMALSWRPGAGAGVLANELALPTLSSTATPQVGDFNQDGFSDLAWFRFGSNELAWLPGGPAGLPMGATQILLSNVQEGGQISQLDFDGDQDMDVVIMEEAPGNTRLIRGYANLGGGSFSSTPVTIGEVTPQLTSTLPRKLTVTDLGGDGDLDLITDGGYWYENEQAGVRGDSYCGPAALNSTGAPGRILTLGSTDPTANSLQLRAADLPALSFGYFVTSQTQRAATAVPGSSGLICIGGAIGRYSIPSQVRFSGLAGMFDLALDLSQMPTPNGLIPALPGSTWNFQAWFRDSSPIGATSNFTDAVAIEFQ